MMYTGGNAAPLAGLGFGTRTRQIVGSTGIQTQGTVIGPTVIPDPTTNLTGAREEAARVFAIRQAAGFPENMVQFLYKYRPLLYRREYELGNIEGGVAPPTTAPLKTTFPANGIRAAVNLDPIANITGAREEAQQAYAATNRTESYIDWMRRNRGRLYAREYELGQITGGVKPPPAATVSIGADLTKIVPPGPYEKWEAPKTGGPYALNARGQWFTVSPSMRKPGHKIVGQYYIPPLSPRVRKTIPEFNKTIPAEKRFTDPKMRAANVAVMRKNFRELYFDIAPRGAPSHGKGMGAGYRFEGTAEDYDAEGGNLYPNLAINDPQAYALFNWWQDRAHIWDTRYGAPQLTLNWLSVYTGTDGYQEYKPWTRQEFIDYLCWWMIASPGHVCGGDECINIGNRAFGLQAERGRAQPEGNKTPHFVWHTGPVSHCAVKSSKRRRKAIKKIAAIAAVVVGAIYLGPMIAGALKGGAATAAAGGKAALGAKALTGAKMIGAAGSLKTAVDAAAGAAVVAEKGTTIINAARDWIPKVVDVANNVRTVKAIADGEIPPPPITLEGNNFREYATSVAEQILEKELSKTQERLTQVQADNARAEIEAEIARLQNDAARRLPPPAQVIQYPIPQLQQPTQQIIQAEQQGAGDVGKMAIMALPVVAALFMMR